VSVLCSPLLHLVQAERKKRSTSEKAGSGIWDPEIHRWSLDCPVMEAGL